MSTTHTPIRRHRGLRRLGRALIALGVLLVTAILIALLVDRIFFDSSSSQLCGHRLGRRGDAGTLTSAVHRR